MKIGEEMKMIGEEELERRSSVLSKSFMLLGALAAVDGCATAAAIATGISPLAGVASMVGSIVVLLILCFGMKDSSNPARISMSILFAVLMGVGSASSIKHYLEMPHGAAMVRDAFFLAMALFGSLAAYAAVSRKDFSFLGGWLFSGLVVLVAMGILNIFLGLSFMALAGSAMGVLIFSGYTLYDVSRAVNDKDADYVDVALNLYLDLANLFMDILRLLASFGD